MFSYSDTSRPDPDAKRLALYPKRVQKIKRMRKQILDLNRCIQSLKKKNAYHHRMNSRLVYSLSDSSKNNLDSVFNCLIGGVFGALWTLLIIGSR